MPPTAGENVSPQHLTDRRGQALKFGSLASARAVSANIHNSVVMDAVPRHLIAWGGVLIAAVFVAVTGAGILKDDEIRQLRFSSQEVTRATLLLSTAVNSTLSQKPTLPSLSDRYGNGCNAGAYSMGSVIAGSEPNETLECVLSAEGYRWIEPAQLKH